jgi:DNA (cytosine-5)-methyltransferase 1
MTRSVPLTAIDLFCGAGGFSAGLLQAGFDIVGAVDAWPVAVETYGLNFTHPVLNADVSELTAATFWKRVGREPVPIDIVVGGPPCQGFSIQRRGNDEDARNDLVSMYARFVCDVRPRMFIMENVPGLLGKRGREILDRFVTTVERGGYGVRYALVNAADFGVPQRRRRVLFFGWRLEDVAPFIPPIPTHSPEKHRTVREALMGLPAPSADRASAASDDPLHYRMRLSDRNVARLRQIPPGKGFESLPVDQRADCHKQGADRIGHRNVYGRLDYDVPSATITARFDSFTRGMFAHPAEHRNITLREGSLLQSFDRDFRFKGTQEEMAALIGNAVPPLLARVMGSAIAEHLLGLPRQAPRRDTSRVVQRVKRCRQLDLFGRAEVSG